MRQEFGMCAGPPLCLGLVPAAATAQLVIVSVTFAAAERAAVYFGMQKKMFQKMFRSLTV